MGDVWFAWATVGTATIWIGIVLWLLRRMRDSPVPLQIVARDEGTARRRPPPPSAASAAVILVSDYNMAGIHTLTAMVRRHPGSFSRVVVVWVGGEEGSRGRGESVGSRYVALIRLWGLVGERSCVVGSHELEQVLNEIRDRYPRACCVLGVLTDVSGGILTWSLPDGLSRQVRECLVRLEFPTLLYPTPAGQFAGGGSPFAAGRE